MGRVCSARRRARLGELPRGLARDLVERAAVARRLCANALERSEAPTWSGLPRRHTKSSWCLVKPVKIRVMSEDAIDVTCRRSSLRCVRARRPDAAR